MVCGGQHASHSSATERDVHNRIYHGNMWLSEWIRAIILSFWFVVNWWHSLNGLQRCLSSLRNAVLIKYGLMFHPLNISIHIKPESKTAFSLWILCVRWKNDQFHRHTVHGMRSKPLKLHQSLRDFFKIPNAINLLRIEQTYVRSITNDVSHQLFISKLFFFLSSAD